jgi:hypothetical protein
MTTQLATIETEIPARLDRLPWSVPVVGQKRQAALRTKRRRTTVPAGELVTS